MRVIAILILLLVTIVLSYFIQTIGWWLSVHSWPWVILGNLALLLVVGLQSALGKD